MKIIPDFGADWLQMLVLTAPFLVTMVALHVIFFGPLLQYLEERNAKTEGARKDAKAMDEDTERKLAQLETSLTEARSQSAQARNEARKTGLAEEQAILAKARAAADERIAQAVSEITIASAEAAKTLKDTAASLANDITAQVLGRDAAGENA